jgi:hypothetical protein
MPVRDTQASPRVGRENIFLSRTQAPQAQQELQARAQMERLLHEGEQKLAQKK